MNPKESFYHHEVPFLPPLFKLFAGEAISSVLESDGNIAEYKKALKTIRKHPLLQSLEEIVTTHKQITSRTSYKFYVFISRKELRGTALAEAFKFALDSLYEAFWFNFAKVTRALSTASPPARIVKIDAAKLRMLLSGLTLICAPNSTKATTL